MKVTVGRIVHYKLGAQDAMEINRRRDDFRNSEPVRTGHIGHIGNRAGEGEVYPAVVVRVFDSSVNTSNLQVLLDGNDHFWATSRQEGDGPGYWSWPPRS